MAGETRSFGAGDYDGWLVKLDSTGQIEWEKTFGGSEWDYFSDALASEDGGCVTLGYAGSLHENSIWVIKLDASGNVEWEKLYLDTYEPYRITETNDGGYVVSGRYLRPEMLLPDIHLIALDNLGNISWERTYGGDSTESAGELSLTSDGGYILSTVTSSFGLPLNGLWFLKLNERGMIDASCPITHEAPVQVIDVSSTANSSTATVVPTNATQSNMTPSMTPVRLDIIENCTPVDRVGEAWDVTLVKYADPGHISISFEPAPHAVSHVVYRGTLASLSTGVYDHTVLVTDSGGCPGDPMPDIVIRDTGGLATSGDFYYLVVGLSACCEGSYGRDSINVERLNATDCGGSACFGHCP